MRSASTLATLVLLGSMLIQGAMAAPFLSVSPVAPLPLQADPGTILSTGLRILGSDTAIEVEESLELPFGWEAVLPSSTFTVPPIGTTRVLALRVPTEAVAGDYAVEYRLTDLASGDPVATTILPITVAQRSAVRIAVDGFPEAVIAGQEIRSPVLITNRGNTPVALQLASTLPDPGYDATIEPATLALQPGASAEVVLVVTGPADESSARALTIKLAARTSNNLMADPVAMLLLQTRVLPTSSGTASTDLVLPATLRFGIAGEDREFSPLVEFRAEGPIDEARAKWLDLLVRTPESLNDSPLGLRETYRLRYEDPLWAAQLGDGFYNLSPLTTRLVETRGFGFAWTPDDAFDTKAGGFHTFGTGRFEDQATALYYKRAVSEALDLRVNLATVDPQSIDEHRRELFSLEASGDAEPIDYRVELAGGHEREGDWEGAYRARVRGKWDDLQLTFDTTHAGPEYPGPYRDLHSTRTGIQFPVAERLTGTASYATHARNLDRDPDRFSASREERWQAALRYQFDQAWHLGLGFEQLDRRDRLNPSDFDVHERLANLVFGQTKTRLSWRAQLRAGVVDDRLRGTNEFGTDYRLDLTWRPEDDTYLQLFTGMSDTTSGTLLGGGRDFLGLRGTYDVDEALQLQGAYAAYGLGQGERRHDEGEVSARYTGVDGTAWEMILRMQHAEGLDSTVPFRASYTVPLELKVGKRKSVGVVEGRIIATGGLAGLSDVVLTLGDVVAVSRPDGTFSFPPLPAGTHALDLDLNTVGLDRITLEALPMPIAVVGGETTTVSLTVVAAASLSGRLADPKISQSTQREGESLYTVEQQPIEPGALDGLVLELTNGIDTLRRVTVDNGAYAFERLRPGTWTLTVYPGNLPVGYELAQDSHEVTLAEGESLVLDVQLRPKRREIRIVPSNQ